MKKRIISVVTAVAFAITVVFTFDMPNIVALAVTASGTYDSGLTWSLDNSGKLTISGSGDIPYLDEMRRPYREHLNNITSVVIENGVRNIGGYAFYNCTALNDVTISNSVTSIGPAAFNECTALENIVIPNSVTSIDTNVFAGCTKLKNITISNSLEDIGRNAFNGCNALEVITIPSSVTFIGMSAFDGCSNLKNVTLESTTPPSIGLNAFPSEVTALNVPCNAIDTYKNAKVWSTYADKIQPQHSGATEVRNVKAATCTAKGYTGDTYCKVCDTKLETGTEIAMTAHSYSTAWLKDSSNHWHKCENCTAINGKAAHTWDNGKVTTAATCTAKGVKTYTCSVCGQTKTEDIATTGHSTVKIAAVAPTCTATGLTEGEKCSVCGTITKAQTTVAAKGHTLVTDPAAAATCTTAGKTAGEHCSVCNTITKTQEIVPALTHDFGEWTVVNAATCTTAGTKERTCNRAGCGAKEMGTIPANGHSYTDGICTVCGAIDAEHEHTGGTVTCKDKAFCSICGEPYGDLAAHTLIHHEAVTATCTDDGNGEYWECSVCNKIFSDENGETEIGSVPTIPALGHNYVDGMCTECGGTDPTYNTSGNATENVQDTAGTNAGLVMDNSLLNNALDTNDLTDIANGHNFEIVLEVTDIRDSVSSADVAAASSALKSGEEIGAYVDLSLYKIKDNDTVNRTPIHDASGQIGITLTIPESIYASDRTYSIIRVHNGIVENLGGTYDKATRSLTFYTDKFSTYAIAFTASSVNMDSPTIPTNPTAPTTPSIPSTPTTGGTTPSTPSVPAVTPTVTETTTKTEEEIISDDEPYIEDVSSGAGIYEIDDNSQAPLCMVVIIIAALGFTSITIVKRFGKNKR